MSKSSQKTDPNTKKGKTPHANEGENLQCHVHDDIKRWDNIDDIRQNVCITEEEVKKFGLKEQFPEFEGKHYCLFHLPTKDKDTEKFNEIFEDRLNDIDQKCISIENEFSEDEEAQINAKRERNIFYDYRYVWFPSELDLTNRKFSAYAYFRSATFTGYAYFRSATFTGYAYFSSATFTGYAYFRSATFTGYADFSSATFTGYADFRSAKFLETSQTFFYQTSFQQVADFQQSVVKGYLYFEAGFGEFFDGEWLDEEKTKPKKIKRRTNVFEDRLVFAHVRAEKPERITFNKVRLNASWFVNIDSRKFVLTDIAWENHRASKAELRKELIALTRRRFKKPHNFQLLTIAFRNLAANAEEFNRFEEASNFRKSASECERLERLNRRKGFWKDLNSLWNKNIFCWDFIAETKKTLVGSWKVLKKAPFDFVHFLYRWLSGYGEKWFRAFVWLFVIWFVFAFVYFFVQGFENNLELGLSDSFGYSLQVMTLQKPDPRPAGFTRVIYGFETILAPLQAALLALAIRRKFMR